MKLNQFRNLIAIAEVAAAGGGAPSRTGAARLVEERSGTGARTRRPIVRAPGARHDAYADRRGIPAPHRQRHGRRAAGPRGDRPASRRRQRHGHGGDVDRSASRHRAAPAAAVSRPLPEGRTAADRGPVPDRGVRSQGRQHRPLCRAAAGAAPGARTGRRKAVRQRTHDLLPQGPSARRRDLASRSRRRRVADHLHYLQRAEELGALSFVTACRCRGWRCAASRR